MASSSVSRQSGSPRKKAVVSRLSPQRRCAQRRNSSTVSPGAQGGHGVLVDLPQRQDRHAPHHDRAVLAAGVVADRQPRPDAGHAALEVPLARDEIAPVRRPARIAAMAAALAPVVGRAELQERLARGAPRAQRDRGGQPRPAARRAVDREGAAQRGDPVLQAAQARAAAPGRRRPRRRRPPSRGSRRGPATTSTRSPVASACLPALLTASLTRKKIVTSIGSGSRRAGSASTCSGTGERAARISSAVARPLSASPTGCRPCESSRSSAVASRASSRARRSRGRAASRASRRAGARRASGGGSPRPCAAGRRRGCRARSAGAPRRRRARGGRGPPASRCSPARRLATYRWRWTSPAVRIASSVNRATSRVVGTSSTPSTPTWPKTAPSASRSGTDTEAGPERRPPGQDELAAGGLATRRATRPGRARARRGGRRRRRAAPPRAPAYSRTSARRNASPTSPAVRCTSTRDGILGPHRRDPTERPPPSRGPRPAAPAAPQAAAATFLARDVAPGLRRRGRDERGQELAGVGAGRARDLLGRALGDDQAALLPALGAHVDEAVGGLDDVEVVLDDHDGVALRPRACAGRRAAARRRRSAGPWSARRGCTASGRWRPSTARWRA